MKATSQQQDLFESHGALSAESLADFLRDRSGAPVNVTLTRNRATMLTIDFSDNDAIRVRMHEHFLQAPPHVLKSLRSYLRSRRKAHWRVLSDYAQSIPLTRRHLKTNHLRTRGSTYDLAEILQEANERFFSGNLRCRITWGRRRSPTRRGISRSIHFGSYDRAHGVVRVHPVLDDPGIPREFVMYIVFHEMLHAVVPPEQRSGRTIYHTAAFRKLERQFPGWEEMQALVRRIPGTPRGREARTAR